MSTALVVFSDNTGVWWLRYLKPGFRHCFIMLETDRGCVWVDPLSTGLTIKPLEGFELAGLMRWYKDQGMRVVKVNVASGGGAVFNWAPMTCVEVAKRLIGLRDSGVITPWQLYQKLQGNRQRAKNRKKILDFSFLMR